MIIDYQKYTFLLKPLEPIFLPAYKGSTFRGGFGVAFKKVVCVFRQKECRNCTLNKECPYFYIFETAGLDNDRLFPGEKYEAIPHPFVLEPPLEDKEIYQPDDLISFDLILIGKALKYVLYFIMAFEYLGEIGIGRGRGKFKLVEVKCGSEKIYSGEERTLTTIKSAKAEIPEEFDSETHLKQSVVLDCLTPIRIKHARDFVSLIEFYVLVTNLLRRMALLNFYHGSRNKPVWDHKKWIGSAKNVIIKESSLRWVDWERYSHRQKAKMKLGGVLGRVVYEGDIKKFLPLVQAGEIFHVGKGTSFGLGQYKIKELFSI